MANTPISPISKGKSYFEVRHVQGKGKGVVATTGIARGTRILSERPFLTAPSDASGRYDLADLRNAFEKLSPDDQRQFLSLHNAHVDEDTLLGIFNTNALPCDKNDKEHHGAVFLVACRFNHSCRPNARYSWNQEKKVEVIHAVTNIRPGEEITVSYLGDDEVLPVQERREHLEASFGFVCTCRLCALPSADAAVSERRMVEAAHLGRKSKTAIEQAADGENNLPGATGPQESLAWIRRMLQLFAHEFGEDLLWEPVQYDDARYVLLAHGDQARASVMARRAYDACVVCCGEDGALSGYYLDRFEELAGAAWFGPNERWVDERDAAPEPLAGEEFEQWLWMQGKYKEG